MKFWHRYGRFIPLFFTIVLVLAGCSPSALNPVGKVAKMEGGIMAFSLAIMLLVIVVVMIIFFYAIIRFRKRKDDDTIPEQVEGNTKMEIAWTVIPILLLVILVIPMVYQVFVLAKDKPSANEKNAITINVTAHQYWWEFQYPNEKDSKKAITTASDLYVPTGTKVYVNLNSKDVIHSFWVPSLFGKQDVNPGTTNHMWFQVSEPGIYNGECAELCGPSHALMDFKVIAVSPDKFKQWQSEMRTAPVKPQSAVAKQGRQVFEKHCMSCHATGNKQSAYPNLNNFGNRTTIAGVLAHNKQNLKDWIHNAPSIKGDIDMPNFSNKLSDKQLNALAEYLMEQKNGVSLPAAPPKGRS